MKHLNIELIKNLINDVPPFKKGIKKESFSEKTKEKIFRTCDYKCAICDSKDVVDAHHIYPQGKGVASNGVALCAMCHMIVHCYLRAFRGYRWVPYWEERHGMFHQQLAIHMTTVGFELRKIREQIELLKRGKPIKDWREFDNLDEYLEHWKQMYYPPKK